VPDPSTFALFAIAALALTLVPGPAVLYIVARSVEGGRPAGLASAVGVAVGGLVHIAFAVVGLSAVLASSATAFAVMKWLGAAYLVYLGLRTILTRNGGGATETPAVEHASLARILRQGIVVNVLNPKTALFFLAFLPQFVEPSQGPASIQIAVLGSAFVLIALTTDSAYALLSGTAATWLRRRRGLQKAQRYVSGSIYIALGAVTAAAGSGKH
jgi:threonine/homoserine/homoserine lactone efflux protein